MAALLVPACGGFGGPGGNLQTATVVVVNNADTFSVSIVGFDCDETVDQNWTCTTGQANLTIGSSVSAGSVDIVVYDGAGAVVYANSHNAVSGLTVQTRPGGTSGTWRVVTAFSDATLAGAITLNADTAPPDADQVTLTSVFGTSDFYTFHAGWGAVSANVIIGGVSAGSLAVVIRDGSNAEVFNMAVPSGGFSGTTSPGQAGTWTIELDFSGASLAGSVSITSP